MLTFFRKIRFGLLAGGHTSKYLKYALGELFLVVVGVFIALQVNNWNEDRQARLLERELINDIIDDLQIDRQNIINMLERGRIKQATHLRLYHESIMENSTEEQEPFTSHILETFSVISQTWDNHKNSVDRISDNDVGSSLNQYFRVYQTLLDHIDIHNRTVLEELRRFAREKEILDLTTIFASSPEKDDIDRTKILRQDQLRSHFGETKFTMLVVELFLGTQDVMQHLEWMMDSNEALIAKLGAANN